MRTSAIIDASRTLAREAGRLSFAPPVRHVYNPLLYAREPAELYLSRYARGRKETVFLGMNPGPWGMAQTGVPFGEVSIAKDWLGIEGRVAAPEDGHPRVPVRGFACTRSEVSGRRLWGLMRERFGSAKDLARHAFVANYCPLLFLDQAGRNITPDRIARSDREPLYAVCDRFLTLLVDTLRPRWLVGVGAFAHQRLLALREVMQKSTGYRGGEGASEPRVVAIPHPSPANPRANRGWAADVRAILRQEGVWQSQGNDSSTLTPT